MKTIPKPKLKSNTTEREDNEISFSSVYDDRDSKMEMYELQKSKVNEIREKLKKM